MQVPSFMPGNSSIAITDTPTVLNAYLHILMGIGWLIFMTVTSVGNLFVIIAYAKDKKIREHASNLIILHLSIVDLLVGTCSMMYPVVLHLNNDYLNIGEYGCKIYLIVDYTAVVLSMAMILCISFDRYWIVKKTIKYRAFQTRGRVKKMLTASWLIVLTTYSAMIIGWDSLPGYQVDDYENCEPAFLRSLLATLILSTLTGYIPMITIAILNILIFAHLWKHSKLFQKMKIPLGHSSSFETEGTSDVCKVQPNQRTVYTISGGKDSQQRPQVKLRELQLRFRQNVHAAIKLVVLVIVFALCWVPLEILNIYAFHCDNCISLHVFRTLAALQWFNSCLNPLLYAATNKRFRDNFKRFLQLCCR